MKMCLLFFIVGHGGLGTSIHRYTPEGIMNGSAKFIPQKPWASVGKCRKEWTSEVGSEMQQPEMAPRNPQTANWAARTAKGRRMPTSPAWGAVTAGGSSWEGVLSQQEVSTAQMYGSSPYYSPKKSGSWIVDTRCAYDIPAHALKGVTLGSIAMEDM
jgi:hypothetical protein